jgi:copper transport outer membrane protein MctB
MFDFRYHALSLVAVLLALMMGVLLGVAVGDKELVSSAGRDVRRSLERDVRRARADAAEARRQVQQRDQVQQDLRTLLVSGRLSGQRVGVVSLGPLSGRTLRIVRDSLKDTGGRIALEAVIARPYRLDGLPAGVTGVRGRKVSEDPPAIRRVGRRFGEALTKGDPLVGRVRRTLVASSSGSFRGLDAVVLVRQDPSGLSARDRKVADAFEDGLADGLSANNVSVVGVEFKSTQPSQVPWYKSQDLASVDNIDDLTGQVSMVLALAGASGAYGVKSTADSLLPPAASAVGAG